MRDMDTDKAAKRTAVNLMRLLESVELKDAAENYSELRFDQNGQSEKAHRQQQLERHYSRWFRSKA